MQFSGYIWPKMLLNFGRRPIRTGVQYSTAENLPANVPEPAISSSNVAQFRKGPGGRSSFSGNVITVFGCTGFTGRRVINHLSKYANQLILPYRCDPYFVRDLKVTCDLGQVLFFPFQLRDEESIRKAVKYSNVVINMVGTYIDTPNYSIYDTNVEGAARIARICREMGVERLVHVSALNADPSYKTRFVKNGVFLKSKGMGEQAVLAEFPNATIIRPSVLFGEYDGFIYKLLNGCRISPLGQNVFAFNAGNGIYKMPLYVNDFANGVTKVAMDHSTAGKTFEFVGPNCYEMCELVGEPGNIFRNILLDYIFVKGGCYRYRRTGILLPWFLFNSFLNFSYTKTHRRPGFINWEWMDFAEATSDVLSGGNTLTLQDLGLELAQFEDVGGWHCFINHKYQKMRMERSQKDKREDWPHPPLPLRSPPLYKQKPAAYTIHDVITEQKAFEF